MYFKPDQYSCMAAQVLQLEGFLLAYGALVLKTWRYIFDIRESVKKETPVKITFCLFKGIQTLLCEKCQIDENYRHFATQALEHNNIIWNCLHSSLDVEKR